MLPCLPGKPSPVCASCPGRKPRLRLRGRGLRTFEAPQARQYGTLCPVVLGNCVGAADTKPLCWASQISEIANYKISIILPKRCFLSSSLHSHRVACPGQQQGSTRANSTPRPGIRCRRNIWKYASDAKSLPWKTHLGDHSFDGGFNTRFDTHFTRSSPQIADPFPGQFPLKYAPRHPHAKRLARSVRSRGLHDLSLTSAGSTTLLPNPLPSIPLAYF